MDDLPVVSIKYARIGQITKIDVIEVWASSYSLVGTSLKVALTEAHSLTRKGVARELVPTLKNKP